MRSPFRGRLWRHADFQKLWWGESISEFGSQVTFLALPSLAILQLHATAFQVGLIEALNFLAFPTLGLVAGVYADRLRRRPIMIACDLGRMLALGSIPVSFVLGSLDMPQLYAVATITGVFTVFFDVAYQSYLPALIDRGDLIEGNSKLEVTRSAAQLLGPAAAGFLIQAFQAARAIAVDALSFLASAIAVWLIRTPEPEPRPTVEGAATGFFAEMREGIAIVFRNQYLWRIAGCTATSNLGSNIAMAVYLIFAYRMLHLSAGAVGLIFGIGSIGYLIGALSAQRSARVLGLGPVLAVSILVGGLSWLMVPLALYVTPFAVLTVSILIGFSTGPIYNINQVSLRQAITPDRVQGRMNATMRTIVWGTIPVGAFLGGVLGTAVGIVETIIIGAVVSTLAVAWVGIGPVRRLREQPAPVA